MRRIAFHRAASLDEALELRGRWGEAGTVIAGGTDLLVALRQESWTLPPLPVIDLTGVEALREIVIDAPGVGDAERVSLGALATHDAIERNDRLRRVAPLLCKASSTVGSPQIRHRGTIGGNIANAASCADTMPPLVALGALLTLQSRHGRREVPVAAFTSGPYRTILQPDEILTAITFPALREREGSAFLKLGRRNALSISRMSVAVVLERGDGGLVRNVRIAGGSVVPTVRRFPEAEACLEGMAWTEEAGTRDEAAGGRVGEAIRASAAALAEAMVRETGRRWSTPYKEPVVQAMAARAIRAALGEPRGALRTTSREESR